MIDLHSHILPGIDDGAADLNLSLEMARIAASQGVIVQACTPHIFPGVYDNTGPQILEAVAALQRELDDAGIDLTLVAGADAHMTPNMIAGLRSGNIPSLAGTRYVLVEPPHHVAPPRIDAFFFDLLAAGYVPVLTHPERLRWIEAQYETFVRLARAGVWMQITSGSLTGAFGSTPKYWAERMLDEGLVHILASDAHGVRRRGPDLAAGRAAAEKWVGAEEAEQLVYLRPYAILENADPSQAAPPPGALNPGSYAASYENRRRPGRAADRRQGGVTAFGAKVLTAIPGLKTVFANQKRPGGN
ncbi:CpsB/CapC family capsule biosynthesis tyrosine phosphatase [Methylocystis echinoides]|uniref:tyrosine-protein phosphatase n=1 Tax=Methylocystis echinoides TaxID=29468 RepID=UPI003431647C